MNNVIIITDYYYPDDISTGYFLTGIAEGLAKHYAVTVICGEPAEASITTDAPARETRRGVQIRRHRVLGAKDGGLISRTARMVQFSIVVFADAVRTMRQGDVFVVVTNPLILAFAAAFAGKLRRARGILLVHDVYPDVLTATRTLREKSLTAMGMRAAFQWLYPRFAGIIVLGRDMRNLIVRRAPRIANRITIIPNWGDVCQVKPESRRDNRLLNELGLSEKFVVQVSGNLGRTHDIETVFESAEQLRAIEDIHFLVASWGIKRSWLDRALADEPLPNMTLLRRPARDDLSILLNAADLLVVPFIPGMSGISVPSRMYNIMAAGKPILASTDHDSELAQVVREEAIGWVVPPRRPQEMAHAILEARTDRKRLRQCGERARLAAEMKYQPSMVVRKYVDFVAWVGDLR